MRISVAILGGRMHARCAALRTVLAILIAVPGLIVAGSKAVAQDLPYPDEIIDTVFPAPVIGDLELQLSGNMVANRNTVDSESRLVTSMARRAYTDRVSVAVRLELYRYESEDLAMEETHRQTDDVLANSADGSVREIDLGSFSVIDNGPSLLIPNAGATGIMATDGRWLISLVVDALAERPFGSEEEREDWSIDIVEHVLSGLP